MENNLKKKKNTIIASSISILKAKSIWFVCR